MGRDCVKRAEAVSDSLLVWTEVSIRELRLVY